MTGQELENIIVNQFDSCRDIMNVKGVDYDDGKDRLSNFKVVAGLVGVDPKVVWAVYATKHFIAIANYCGRGRVESEPIDGRISDLINYSLLLKAIVTEERQKVVDVHSVGWASPQDETLSADVKEVSDYMSVITNICERDATKIQCVPTFPESDIPSINLDPEDIERLIKSIHPEPPPTLNLWERLKQLASS